METARILIAMSNEASAGKLKAILAECGYTVIDQANDGHECLRKLRALKPDLAVVDYGLPLMNGCELARVVREDKLCEIILIISGAQESIMGGAKYSGDFYCMVKPINRPVLINTIELMIKNKKKIEELEKEIVDLKTDLDTRKDVERAKGLLMKNLGLTEPEAFKRIQRQSMDRGIPMREIAKAIILAYDI